MKVRCLGEVPSLCDGRHRDSVVIDCSHNPPLYHVGPLEGLSLDETSQTTNICESMLNVGNVTPIVVFDLDLVLSSCTERNAPCWMLSMQSWRPAALSYIIV